VHIPSRSPSSTAQSDAEAIATDALAWLGEDGERLQRFLALSGLGPQNLRRAAAEPGFLAAILDYLAANEPLLIAFSDRIQRRPDNIMQARRRLAPRRPEDEE
jgi:Protein of unknown function (DUF3572)